MTQNTTPQADAIQGLKIPAQVNDITAVDFTNLNTILASTYRQQNGIQAPGLLRRAATEMRYADSCPRNMRELANALACWSADVRYMGTTVLDYLAEPILERLTASADAAAWDAACAKLRSDLEACQEVRKLLNDCHGTLDAITTLASKKVSGCLGWEADKIRTLEEQLANIAGDLIATGYTSPAKVAGFRDCLRRSAGVGLKHYRMRATTVGALETLLRDWLSPAKEAAKALDRVTTEEACPRTRRAAILEELVDDLRQCTDKCHAELYRMALTYAGSSASNQAQALKAGQDDAAQRYAATFATDMERLQAMATWAEEHPNEDNTWTEGLRTFVIPAIQTMEAECGMDMITSNTVNA